jgi:hypothetical protein
MSGGLVVADCGDEQFELRNANALGHQKEPSDEATTIARCFAMN